MATLPLGVFPTMITPFTADKAIDWARVDEWYIQNGCTGIFSVCQSSEMYHLTRDERLQLAKRVKDKAAGRVVVVASGTFEGSLEEKAEFVKEMGKIVDAVVVLVNQMCSEGEDHSVWRANVQKLIDLTDNVPLGLYECPVPYHRCLDAETLKWCAETQRFFFHKDTCCKRGEIAEKLAAIKDVKTPFRFYNANVATLQYSMQLGGSGFSGICANFYPQLVAWLVAHFADPAAARVQDWLSVSENVVMFKYPISAKTFLSQFESFGGTPICRSNSLTLNEEEGIKIGCLMRLTARLCEELGLPAQPPHAQ